MLFAHLFGLVFFCFVFGQKWFNALMLYCSIHPSTLTWKLYCEVLGFFLISVWRKVDRSGATKILHFNTYVVIQLNSNGKYHTETYYICQILQIYLLFIYYILCGRFFEGKRRRYRMKCTQDSERYTRKNVNKKERKREDFVQQTCKSYNLAIFRSWTKPKQIVHQMPYI